MSKEQTSSKEYLEKLGITYAKKLKLNKTKWEIILYKHLINLGLKFKFQEPVVLPIRNGYKLYILDFVLEDYKLIIEVDGLKYHSTKSQVKSDNLRTKRLKKEGYEILRFWNKQIETLTEQHISYIITNKTIMLNN